MAFNKLAGGVGAVIGATLGFVGGYSFLTPDLAHGDVFPAEAIAFSLFLAAVLGAAAGIFGCFVGMVVDGLLAKRRAGCGLTRIRCNA
jgi:hypothetical protein